MIKSFLNDQKVFFCLFVFLKVLQIMCRALCMRHILLPLSYIPNSTFWPWICRLELAHRATTLWIKEGNQIYSEDLLPSSSLPPSPASPSTEIWTQFQHLQSRYRLTHTFPPPRKCPFCLGYFGDGSLKLFASASLELQSSLCHPPK
jgi:hypothetical protein